MKSEKTIIFLLALVNFVCIVDFMLLMPLGDTLMKLFQITPKQFSAVVSVYSITAGLTGLVTAPFMDRFDRKRLLLITFLGFIIGTFCCYIAHNYMQLLLCRALTGMFGGIVGGVVVSIVSDIIPYDRRASAMSIISAAFALAAVAGVPFGLYMSHHYGWNTPFLSLAVFSAFILIAILFIIPSVKGHLEETERGSYNPITVVKKALSITNQRNALGLAFFMVLGHFMVIQFIVPYMIRNVGFTESLVPLMYFIGGVCTIITSPIVGKIADKYGNLKIYIIMAILSFIPMLLTTHMQRANVSYAMIVCAFFFILASGRMIPAQTLITGATTADQRGSFMSLRSACLELGAGIASYISGLIVVEGPDGRFMHYHLVGYLAVAIGCLSIYFATQIKIVNTGTNTSSL